TEAKREQKTHAYAGFACPYFVLPAYTLVYWKAYHMEIKGAVHVHSTYSRGGKESLESLRAFLLKQGVTFCCVTEHAEGLTTKQAQLFVQECKVLSGSQFVFIPGFEVAYLPAHARRSAHVLLIGTEVFFEQEVDAALLATWSQ